MSVVHVVPSPSIFASVIQKFADDAGQKCFLYRIERKPWSNVRDWLVLRSMCKKYPDATFVFHRVPHFRIALLAYSLRKFHYCLLYWGDDYYSTFLNEVDFEQHCIRKSALLNPQHYRQRHNSILAKCLRQCRRYLGLRVVAGAEAVLSLTPKHFRLLKFFYLQLFGAILQTPRILARGYSATPDVAIRNIFKKTRVDEITVVICHSATASVAHEQTLEILQKYEKRWQAKIHVRGFLSYSGGDESDRDALEIRLREKSEFAESVYFERKFLSMDEMQNRLDEFDVAVFSCLRDEGVSLLTQFARSGGMLSFDKYSFNYDFFRDVFPSKLLSHEGFLDLSPEQIRQHRNCLPDPPSDLLPYSEISNLKIRA